MRLWPFSEIEKLRLENERVKKDNEIWKKQVRSFNDRDLETEHVSALNAQITILGDKARDHDMLAADMRRLRMTLREVYPRDLEHAEDLKTPLVDLVIWLLRGRPGPERGGE